MNVKNELFVELTDAELESACGGSWGPTVNGSNFTTGPNAQSIGNTSSGSVGNFTSSAPFANTGGYTYGSYASPSNYYGYYPFSR